MDHAWKVLALSIGGVLGVNARYWLGLWMNQWASPKFPWATFTINVTGSFAIGFLTIVLARWLPNANARLFLITGLLGGYTTFSAYSFESLSMWERGDRWAAFAYVFGSVLAGLIAVTLGVALARAVAPEVDERAVVTASGPGPGEEEHV
jgi:CrcB protein